MLPKLCPAVMLAVCTTPGSVNAMCASGMAKGMARRQPSGSDGPTTIWHQSYPLASARTLPPSPVLGLRQGHFNPAVLPPPTLRLIWGSGPTLAIALSDQALGWQGKMLLQVLLDTPRPPFREDLVELIRPNAIRVPSDLDRGWHPSERLSEFVQVSVVFGGDPIRIGGKVGRSGRPPSLGSWRRWDRRRW